MYWGGTCLKEHLKPMQIFQVEKHVQIVQS